MSNPNTERDERGVRRIRKTLVTMQRMEHDDIHAHVYVRDVTKLLSLYDSQAVEMIALRKEVAASERYQALLLDQPDAATRMRDRCVERMKGLRDEWESKRNELEPLSKMRNRYDAAFCAANEAIKELQSLTLEQGEQEK